MIIFKSFKERRGFSLLWVILLLFVVMSFSVVALKSVQSDLTFFREVENPYYLQVKSMARSGLIETLNWFRRQPTQPVLAFNPGTRDSQDPSQGIVYEIEVQPGLFLGYKVLRGEVVDISSERGLQPGTMWRITSHGYLRGRLGRRTFNKERTLTAEIIRITLAPPIQAAIIAPYGRRVRLDGKVRVIGNNSAGAGVARGGGRPRVINGAVLRGTPNVQFIRDPSRELSPIEYYDSIVNIDSIFGVSEDVVKSVSDIVTDDVNDIPQDFENLLIYFQGNLQFNTKPLRGTGVLIVTGNLMINNNQYNYFSGLIYVKGSINITGNVLINGTIIKERKRTGWGTNDVYLHSTKDFVEVSYDRNILNAIRLRMGNYRFCSAPLPSPRDREVYGF